MYLGINNYKCTSSRLGEFSQLMKYLEIDDIRIMFHYYHDCYANFGVGPQINILLIYIGFKKR